MRKLLYPNHSLRFKLDLKSRAESGFALIATMSVMALVIMIAMAMVSLSTSVVRTSQHGQAMEEAQANARMALMMAIGKLQLHAGSDTRITANADLLVDGAPPLTGVWKSWQGTDHESNGRPIAPNYSAKYLSSDNTDSRFLGYLVSGAESTIDPKSTNLSNLVSTTATDGTIPLLAKGSLGTNPGQVHVKPQAIDGSSLGYYGWWISPENQKARLTQPHLPKSDDLAGRLTMMQSNSVPDPEAFGLAELLNDPDNYDDLRTSNKSVRKSLSRNTLQIASGLGLSVEEADFHNLSVSSIGLQTNVATGGWKKDLSILAEQWDNTYSQKVDGKLPFFRYSPSAGDVSQVPKPTLDDMVPTQSLFYPWSAYPINADRTDTDVSTRSGASASWASLVSFINSYKEMDYDSSENKLSIPPAYWPMTRDHRYGESVLPLSDKEVVFGGLHSTTRTPLVARVQFTVSVSAKRQNPTATNWSRWSYLVDLKAQPTVTLWNPYNTELTIDKKAALGWVKSIPLVCDIRSINTKTDPETIHKQTGFSRLFAGSRFDIEANSGYDSEIPQNIAKGYKNHWFQSNGLYVHFPSTYTIAPGEVLTLGATTRANDAFTGVIVDSEIGYDGATDAGWITNLEPTQRTSGYGALFAGWGQRLDFEMRFDNYTKNGSDPIDFGPGINYKYGLVGADDQDGNAWRYIYDTVHRYAYITNEDYATSYWKVPVDLPEFLIKDIAINDPTAGAAQPTGNPPWTPIFSISMGPSFTLGAGSNNLNSRPTKGLLQNNPYITSMVTSNEKKATNHPVNSAFEFSIHGHADGGSDTLPEDTLRAGQMVTGFQTGNGLSHFILTELPVKPMNSLIELQHWNMQGGKSQPPYQYYVIGNSAAHPVLPKNDTVLDRTADTSSNLVHDDSYCSNHLLFDDWFFSTIAPEQVTLGKQISSSIQDVYKNFLKGNHLLANRSYLPAAGLGSSSDQLVNDTVDDIMNSADGWQRIASQLEVEGMFNINSTSVKAWRALLGHARQMEIYHHTSSGIVKSNTPVDHIVSRHVIPGDQEAKSDETGSGGAFPGASEYGGFRKLSDSDLNDLAEKIVGQIRLRGPFLSLSEFVNRSISDDDNIAQAGAVQTAINSLTNDPNQFLTDPRYSSKAMDPNGPILNGVEVYKNEKAAEGYDTYGFPAWITQSDILRPIAPVLSARDDTFTIRAYGDARDKNGKIIAQAWCEAIVKRTRNFVDISDDADSTEPPQSSINQKFGRRFALMSFRWLNRDEI